MTTTAYHPLVFLVATLVCFGLVGCRTHDTEEAGHHVLDWKDYTGVEDPQAAVYLFNNKIVGKGDKGYAAIKDILLDLPEGSIVVVAQNYDDPELFSSCGDDLRFPFPRTDLVTFASYNGIILIFGSSTSGN